MGVFWTVPAALLKQFLSNGQNTFDDIVQYLETARLYQTGPQWVDNVFLSTLLIHQFEGTELENKVKLK